MRRLYWDCFVSQYLDIALTCKPKRLSGLCLSIAKRVGVNVMALILDG